MQKLQSDLANHWHRILVVILMITLSILKNRKIITMEEVLEIQNILALVGFLPSNPRKIMLKTRKVAPLLLVFLLFQCKPKQPTLEQQTRAQVNTQLQQNHEKTVRDVSAKPQSSVDSTLANDSEFQQLWHRFSELVSP